MLKVVEIVSAWASFIKPSKSQQERAYKRYEKCISCEDRGELLGVEVCLLCSCPLKVKIFTPATPSEEGGCDRNKWEV